MAPCLLVTKFSTPRGGRKDNEESQVAHDQTSNGPPQYRMQDLARTVRVESSLVNTLPKTKKDKHTAVTEAHIECT